MKRLIVIAVIILASVSVSVGAESFNGIYGGTDSGVWAFYYDDSGNNEAFFMTYSKVSGFMGFADSIVYDGTDYTIELRSGREFVFSADSYGNIFGDWDENVTPGYGDMSGDQIRPSSVSKFLNNYTLYFNSGGEIQLDIKYDGTISTLVAGTSEVGFGLVTPAGDIFIKQNKGIKGLYGKENEGVFYESTTNDRGRYSVNEYTDENIERLERDMNTDDDNDSGCFIGSMQF